MRDVTPRASRCFLSRNWSLHSLAKRGHCTISGICRIRSSCRPAPCDQELGQCHDFSQRAREVALENSTNTWRLAAMVAYQGLKAFLYECLEHPPVNVSVFEGKDRRRTIGTRNALNRLEQDLSGAGRIRQGVVAQQPFQLAFCYHRRFAL